MTARSDVPITIFHNPACDGTSRSAVAMVEHSILVNRPIAVTAKGVKPSRPPEAVLERKPEGFMKGDGEVMRPGA